MSGSNKCRLDKARGTTVNLAHAAITPMGQLHLNAAITTMTLTVVYNLLFIVCNRQRLSMINIIYYFNY
jgi:hypothetical protein